jgi:hypothetical protein
MKSVHIDSFLLALNETLHDASIFHSLEIYAMCISRSISTVERERERERKGRGEY